MLHGPSDSYYDFQYYDRCTVKCRTKGGCKEIVCILDNGLVPDVATYSDITKIIIKKGCWKVRQFGSRHGEKWLYSKLVYA